MTLDKLPLRLAEHPTVRKVASRRTEKPGVIDADWLRQVCLEAGADTVLSKSASLPAVFLELYALKRLRDGAYSGLLTR